MRPFLRWAGGKQKMTGRLRAVLPPVRTWGKYFEPMVGGGALFFALEPSDAVLADVNSDLIECYRGVARDPAAVAMHLADYAVRDSRQHYYDVRDGPCDDSDASRRAARFIYLNKAAFNGIYRVNKAGKFNVPYGPSRRGPVLPSGGTLAAAARCLEGVELIAGDFEVTLQGAQSRDLVYLDPPYPPLSCTAFFTHYSAARFGGDDQRRVAECFAELTKRGCLVILSNADAPDIIKLYDKFRIVAVEVTRWIGANGRRFPASEVIVTNYEPLTGKLLT